VHHQQEEPNRLQGVPSEEVPHGGHVEEWIPIWSSLQLVQDPLSAAGAAAAGGGCDGGAPQ